METHSQSGRVVRACLLQRKLTVGDQIGWRVFGRLFGWTGLPGLHLPHNAAHIRDKNRFLSKVFLGGLLHIRNVADPAANSDFDQGRPS